MSKMDATLYNDTGVLCFSEKGGDEEKASITFPLLQNLLLKNATPFPSI
jgi:hypothetical protein